MAELISKERLLPSLLDRLTDDHPSQTEEGRDQRVSTMKRLREAVLRDIEWLLNTVNLESTVDLDELPEVRDSVINFGLPAMSGTTSKQADTGKIEKIIKRAIEVYEPRIMKNTVRVRGIQDAKLDNPCAIAFQIEGTLWGNPYPEALYFHTELDLELGEVKLNEGQMGEAAT